MFAGVGGIDLGFEQAGFHTVYANEIDPYAVETYKLNFPNVCVENRDIHEVVSELEMGQTTLPSYDILLGGFPCQAFSIAGYREGFNDKKGRGGLFFEIMKIVRTTHPKVVFLENVKNLVSHDNGKTFQIIKDALESEGYHIQAKVMNTAQYGNIPQNRERIYIVGFLDKTAFSHFVFPDEAKLETKLEDMIDFHQAVEAKYYYTPSTFSHYSEIQNVITRQDTVYQWRRKYVRENKSGLCPTLTANMGTGGHNVPLILSDTGIRKLTPRECFNLQGFSKTYHLPNLSNGRLYKQAGNSVSVSVIHAIATKIKEALDY